MKKILVKCPICGKVDKIIIDDSYTCSFCKEINNLNDCKIIYLNYKERDIPYLEECLRKSIVAKNENNIKIYIEETLKKDKNNILANYFNIKSIEDKKNYLFKETIDDEILYFIIKYDVLRMKKVNLEYKKSIINLIKDKEKRDLLLKYTNYESDNKDLFNNLKDEQVEMIEYKGKNKQKQLGMYMIIASLIFAFIVSLICSLTVYEDCVYGTIVAIGIFPSIFLTIGLMKLIETDKFAYGILLFLIFFYFLTYLMTLPHHDVSFLDSFKEHVVRIINAIPDILESITNHSKVDELPKE